MGYRRLNNLGFSSMEQQRADRFSSGIRLFAKSGSQSALTHGSPRLPQTCVNHGAHSSLGVRRLPSALVEVGPIPNNQAQSAIPSARATTASQVIKLTWHPVAHTVAPWVVALESLGQPRAASTPTVPVLQRHRERYDGVRDEILLHECPLIRLTLNNPAGKAWIPCSCAAKGFW